MMRQRPRRIGVHPSFSLSLAIANGEACQAGAKVVRPAHFLLASLIIIDDGYAQAAEALRLDGVAQRAVAEAARECRGWLEMTDDEVTTARRALRGALREGDARPVRVLPRSGDSEYVLQKAGRRLVRMGAEQLSLVHLFHALLDELPDEGANLVRPGVLPDLSELPPPPRSAYNISIIDGDPEAPAGALPAGPDGAGAPSPTPTIDALGRDLTALAREGLLPDVIGREAEMTAVARYLTRTSKRNVIITGEAGVGKSAVVEGLARRLAADSAPEFLRRLRIVQINVGDLLAGAKYRGDLEDRIKAVAAEAAAAPDVVLFFDEIHLLKSGSGAGSPADIANLLKPALANDGIRCMGATTNDEFERYLSGDPAFTRRFQVIRLAEPTEEEALAICRHVARKIEAAQRVRIEDTAVAAAVSLSARHIRGRALPDKAIDLLENAATYVKVTSLTFSDPAPAQDAPTVGREHVVSVLEDQYGFTVEHADVLDAEGAAAALRAELVGQEEAVAALVESIATLARRPPASGRPLGVFMFTGPTGVGKTKSAECLAQTLFRGDAAFARFNMNEYKERHDLARLVGAPPGFVGHENTGALFRFAAANPQGLVLLDEMEKAHPEIQDFFLQIFDNGRARDSRGREADFSHHLFVMTCNVTSRDASAQDIGFMPRGGRELPQDN